ncbi:citrate synthase [Cardiosporidium cionae]|uniref:Citrate synthase n=1 Tax=Cardiosporidium cionae TaxID=476202 RepID=A0ABQ7J823_9APIC|nr:citrate synthase [Cardiosporidium cionae]|eukprot:KAF8820110.1 citrate synthase [Cardiosporidium cionae]
MRRFEAVKRQVTASSPTIEPEKQANELTLVDHRTGKSYRIPVVDNTIRSVDLKAVRDANGDILRTYDPGFMNTICCTSRISFINGEKGILNYRGYPIEELAEYASFPEVAFLLLYGELPSQPQLKMFSDRLIQESIVPENIKNLIRSFRHDSHPMGMFVAAISALGTYHPETNPPLAGQDVYKDKGTQNLEISRVLGACLYVATNVLRHSEGLPLCDPCPSYGFAENFLYMVDKRLSSSSRPHPALVHALDTLFILHAEHELNCSTSALRHLSSSNADVYTSVAGAVGALYGPRHGGANEAVVRMLESIGSISEIPAFIEKVKTKKVVLMGFGHRIYKTYDPRAKIVRRLADTVFSITGREHLIDVAIALEQVALQDDYFRSRHLYPNVDFFSGLIYKALGFPTSYFPVLFALARVAGWLSHWVEFQEDPENRIVRPFQLYKGQGKRAFVPLALRDEKVESKQLQLLTTAVDRRRNLSTCNNKNIP